MSVVRSQQQVCLGLLRQLRPYWRRDAALPARLQRLLAAERRFGARDRRLYRELLYTALRYLPWIEPGLDSDPERAVRLIAWLAAETPATRDFRAELRGDWPDAGSLAARAEFLGLHAADLLPAWLREECPAAFSPAELEAQLARAPLWLRLQTDEPAAVAAEFASLGWPTAPAAVLPTAWRVLAEADVTRSAAFATGRIEVQDLGSQLVLASAAPAAGEAWLDACAGAGGKTLQLARLLGPAGTVDAHDIRPTALAELRQRADRAGLRTIRTVAAPAAGAYAGVLVDAPCSGSGTWRRSPHLKWVTTPATLTERAQRQQELLGRFAAAVRPGGRLVYATCSLCRRENAAVVAAFLAAQPDFAPEPPAHTFGFAPADGGLTILPARHDTDGFFVATLRRR